MIEMKKKYSKDDIGLRDNLGNRRDKINLSIQQNKSQMESSKCGEMAH